MKLKQLFIVPFILCGLAAVAQENSIKINQDTQQRNWLNPYLTYFIFILGI